jgi:hypothetical protein
MLVTFQLKPPVPLRIDFSSRLPTLVTFQEVFFTGYVSCVGVGNLPSPEQFLTEWHFGIWRRFHRNRHTWGWFGLPGPMSEHLRPLFNILLFINQIHTINNGFTWPSHCDWRSRRVGTCTENCKYAEMVCVAGRKRSASASEGTGVCFRTYAIYEGVSKSFGTGRLERELQMVQLSATRCSCIAIMWVSLVSFAAITLCVASQRVFIVVSVYYTHTHCILHNS